MQSRSPISLRRFLAPTTKTTKPKTRLQIQTLEERAVPAIYTVSNINDSGAGSFRQALTDCNTNAGIADSIAFDATTFATPQTISLLTALPAITAAGGAVTINGPGASLATIRRDPGAGTNFGIFSTAANFTVDGVTITGGNAGLAGGINISSTGAAVTVKNSVLTGNTGTRAGAIDVPSGSTALLTVENSTIHTNTGPTGGIYYFSGGALLVRNSTFRNNIGTSANSFNAGAIVFFGTVNTAAGGVTIENSTFVNNSTASTTTGGGGVGFKSLTGTVNVRNSTFTNNTAPATSTGGGGIGASGGTVNIISTIVAQNTGPAASPDFLAPSGTHTGTNSLFGVLPTAFFTSNNNVSGTSGSPLDPLLGALANNGGPTETRLPLVGSPTVDAGSNPANLTTDQRGIGFTRDIGGIDIGAVEALTLGLPSANGSAGDITTPGLSSNLITVNYSDVAGTLIGLNTSTLMTNTAIRVTGPNGYNQLATFVSVNDANNGTPRTATYSVSSPGATWVGADSGLYTIKLEANQVYDLDGNAAKAKDLGTFTVTLFQTRTVTTNADSGTGSLRDIITLSNADTIPDEIVFDPTAFGTATTISLLSALPTFGTLATAGALKIIGPGANLLTVTRDATAGTNFAIFNSSNSTLNMSGITVTGGNSGSAGITVTGGGTLNNMVFTANTSTTGGTIRLASGTLNVLNSTVTGNTVTGSGGGIYAVGGTTLNVTNTTIANNTVSVNGGGIGGSTTGFTLNVLNSTIADNTATTTATTRGGGIFLGGGANATIRNSTISGNDSSDRGGGVYFFNGGSLLMENSTVNDNTTTGSLTTDGGGGIYFFGTATSLVIRNSTIANNTTGASGGGLLLKTFTGTATIQNSTIVGNISNSTLAANGGGGIGRVSGAGVINITNSIVSGNTINGGGAGSATGVDILGSGTSQFSAIGDTAGYTDTDGTTNLPAATDLMLSPLGNHGGTTQTMVPLSGSPLINAGSVLLTDITTTSDQVGGTRVRNYGTNVDIGSFEVQPPKVTVNQAVGQADPTNGDITFDIVFNVPVSDFDINDLTLTSPGAGGTVTGFSGSGTTYQAVVTGMAGEGDVTLSVAAGVATDVTTLPNDASTSTDNTVRFDQVAPTVDIDVAGTQNDPTNDAAVDFTVTFSEAVTGFTDSDIDFTGSTVTGTLSAVVTLVSPGVYNVAVSGMTSDGDVVINFAANAATDLIGNGNAAPTITENVVTVDNTAPTVTVEQIGAIDPTGGSSTAGVQFLATFTENMVGLDISDVDLTGTTAAGATVTSVTGSGTTFTITISGMTSGGLIKASIPANATTDIATNGNQASTSTDNEITFVLSGLVALDAATYTVSEQGSPQLTVTVKRTGGSEGAVSVNYGTTGVSALAGSDYTTASGTLTWAAGDSADKTFNIPILDDSDVEGSETLNVTLSGITVPGALGTPSSAIVTITDYEEGDITFDAGSYTVNEAGTATVTVKRLNGGSGSVDVTYGFTLGTAEATDIGTPSIPAGTLTWADGDTADKVITIPITEDIISEAYETVNFSITGPTNGAVLGANAAATLTIQPSDAIRISGLNGFKPITLIDTDLDKVVVSFGGKLGFLDIFKTDDQAPIGLLQVGGGADPLKASVTVKVSKPKGGTGDGKTAIEAIVGTGLKAITATKSDLTGAGININGSLGSVKLGNILNGADIIALGTAVQKTKIAAGTVGDNSLIQLGSILSAMTVTSFGDSDIVAPSAGKITVKGNFNGDVTLSGLGVDHVKAKRTLTALTVKGITTNADINVVGNIGSVTTYGFVNSRLFGGYTGPDNGVGGTFNPTIKTTINSFKSLANAKVGLTGLFDNSSIIAENLNSATLAAVDEANGADEFGIFVNTAFKTVSITDTKQKFVGVAFSDQDFSIKIV